MRAGQVFPDFEDLISPLTDDLDKNGKINAEELIAALRNIYDALCAIVDPGYFSDYDQKPGPLNDQDRIWYAAVSGQDAAGAAALLDGGYTGDPATVWVTDGTVQSWIVVNDVFRFYWDSGAWFPVPDLFSPPTP